MIVKQQQKPMIRNYFLNNKKGTFHPCLMEFPLFLFLFKEGLPYLSLKPPQLLSRLGFCPFYIPKRHLSSLQLQYPPVQWLQ